MNTWPKTTPEWDHVQVWTDAPGFAVVLGVVAKTGGGLRLTYCPECDEAPKGPDGALCPACGFDATDELRRYDPEGRDE